MEKNKETGFAMYADINGKYERLYTSEEVIEQLQKDKKILQSKIDKVYEYLDKFIPNEYGYLLTERQWEYIKSSLKENN